MKESLLRMVCPTVPLSVKMATPQTGESGTESGQFYADELHHYKTKCKKNTHVVLQRICGKSALLRNLELSGYTNVGDPTTRSTPLRRPVYG